MSHQQRARRSASQPDRSPGAWSRLAPEEEAVRAGVRAGDAALAHFEASGFLLLFTDQGQRQASTQGLDVLRSYAELRRTLLSIGHDIPATSLVAAGYNTAEIAHFDAMIALIPARAGSISLMKI
jgi:hypothetical protein